MVPVMFLLNPEQPQNLQARLGSATMNGGTFSRWHLVSARLDTTYLPKGEGGTCGLL